MNEAADLTAIGPKRSNCSVAIVSSMVADCGFGVALTASDSR